MADDKELAKIKQLVLAELEAASDRIDVVCWDKGCKYALDINFALADEAPPTRKQLLAIAKRRDVKQLVIEALNAASDIDVVCWDKGCKYALALSLDSTLAVVPASGKKGEPESGPGVG